MKATELMIGDWVYDKINANNIIIAQMYLMPEWCDNFLPIPLTPEILEKNGFRFHSFGRDCKWERPEFVINDLMIDSVGQNNFHYEYVHQLQHALRLCGLETLADNFKV